MDSFIFIYVSANLIERDLPNECNAETNIVQSRFVVVRTPTDIREFHRKSYVYVFGTYFVDVGVSLSDRNVCAWVDATLSAALYTVQKLGAAGKGAIDENHYE